MTVDQLRTAYKAVPFHPFVLHLADGRSIPVSHPEFVLPAPSGRTAIVYQSDDSWNVVDLPLVTDLEFAPRANGGRKGKQRPV
jgi:hypothetical protein